MADVIVKTSEVQAEELEKQNEIAEKQVQTFSDSIAAQIAVQQANVDEKRAMYDLKKSQVDQLKVRPGIDGVLQELTVEVGQKVTQGTVLARVAQPTHLKAALKIAETQAKDIQIGQKASVDTHNGIIAGHVMRIDPAVVNGTVTVDVALDGALPTGARPDLSVEGTVEIERLTDVLYVGRPVHGEANSTVGLFKVIDGSGCRARAGGIGPHVGEYSGNQEGLADGRYGDSLRHVRLGQLRSDAVEVSGEHFGPVVRSLIAKEHRMNSDAQSLIRLEGVTKVFYTDEVETHALAGVHLDIKNGEFLSIAGPSGCGKSTLLSILGLLDSPTDGNYWINKQAVANLSLSDRTRIRNREIGFIFQAFNLIGDLTVFENVELPLTYRSMASAERKKRVQEVLERVGMAHRMKHYPSQLSGGQQQRVAVARALVGQPSILLADEPTGNLDSKNSEAVMDLLRQLHREGATICMVTHDPRYASIADRTIHLFDGRIVEETIGTRTASV